MEISRWRSVVLFYVEFSMSLTLSLSLSLLRAVMTEERLMDFSPSTTKKKIGIS